MEIDDDEINEIEEFEKDNGNRTPINGYSYHKKILKMEINLLRFLLTLIGWLVFFTKNKTTNRWQFQWAFQF
jgi:hypothetical protein